MDKEQDRRDNDPKLIGLCARCRQARVIRSDRGSTFYLCSVFFVDRRFPKYPRLPVLNCTAFDGQPAP
jgi:hypothetical protein